jgi:hypothetical protein
MLLYSLQLVGFWMLIIGDGMIVIKHVEDKGKGVKIIGAYRRCIM